MAALSSKRSSENSFIYQNLFSFLKVKAEDLYLFFGLLLFRLLCDSSYLIVKLVFNYENPFIYDPTLISQIISWLFLLSLFPLIFKVYRKKTLSCNVIFLLSLIALIPSTSLIGANSYYSATFIFLSYAYWFLLLSLCIKIPMINLDYFRGIRSEYFYNFILFIMCISVIYLSWTNTGFRFIFNILDSQLIYDTRLEAREYGGIPFLGYLIHAADNLLPILMIYLFSRGKKIIALFVGLIILLNFGITASKQLFLLLCIVFFSYLFIKEYSLQRFFLFGAILVTFFSIVEFYLLNTAITSMFSTYRIFFIPAKYHYIYFEFFSIFEPDYFRQSFLRIFFDSPYERSLHMVLADFHNRDYYARANVGLLSDAIMNLGYIGAFIFPILLIMVLKLLDGASKGLAPSVLFMTTICLSFLFLNLNLTIALITGGVIFMIPILYSLPRKGEIN
ncbi:MAG: hypothetical protein CMI90_07020 [Pelagibacteraceae bacterium]|nr:hypothetical protein [Pelagibacteraceae bacterium]